MQFPSQAWADAFCAALNANAEYAEAAAAWEGDVLLKVLRGDGGASGIALSLSHGRCTQATYLPEAATEAREFVFEGSEAVWSRLFRREVDPVSAILGGTIKVRGNMAKLLRFTRAAKELVSAAGQIPVDG
ncbi:MAG: SCP2 sterol-binding domain-containing protein [Thermoplasmata archaeon]